jgi:hypothetical protein
MRRSGSLVRNSAVFSLSPPWILMVLFRHQVAHKGNH